MKILVVGATGVLGRSVVRRLLAAGVAVRALARTPEHAAGLANQGAEVVEGDLVDAGSLERACAGTDRVLAAAHSLLGRGRYRSDRVDGAGHRALIDAARAAVKGGSSERALVLLRRYDSSYPGGAFRPEALALRIEALDQDGRRAEAQALARDFLARYPHSPVAERVARVAAAK